MKTRTTPWTRIVHHDHVNGSGIVDGDMGNGGRRALGNIHRIAGEVGGVDGLGTLERWAEEVVSLYTVVSADHTHWRIYKVSIVDVLGRPSFWNQRGYV